MHFETINYTYFQIIIYFESIFFDGSGSVLGFFWIYTPNIDIYVIKGYSTRTAHTITILIRFRFHKYICI